MSYSNRQWPIPSQELPSDHQSELDIWYRGDATPSTNRSEIDWARTQLSIGACAIELGKRIGLSDVATEELATAYLRLASGPEKASAVQSLYDLLDATDQIVRISPDSEVGENISSPALGTVTDLGEYKEKRKATPKKPSRIKKAKSRRELKVEVPFLAPSKKMSDKDLVAHFLPEIEDEQALFIKNVCEGIDYDLSAAKESDKDLEHELSDQTSRGMSLLVHVLNYYRANDQADSKSVREISSVLGRFIKGMGGYMYTVAQPLVHENSSLTLEDLIAEGELGLIEALGKYDLGWEGMRFIGYARKRVHGAMVDAIRDRSNIIRVSRGDMTRLKYYREMTNSGMTLDEIADFLDILPAQLEHSIAKAKSASTLTLDTQVSSNSSKHEGEEMNLLDIVDDHELSTEDLALGSDAEAVGLAELVDNLSDRDADAIRMRFGLPPYSREHKLDEIGEKHGFTGSRASQVVSENLAVLYSMLPHDMRFRRRRDYEDLDLDE